MTQPDLPVLYSFRRCPYAMRARIALYYSGVVCELREVVLKSKPAALLAASPKATVPVLLLNSGADKYKLIEESIEIIEWALNQSDPDDWLDQGQQAITHDLIKRCDGEFKHWLDRYKYADRYPEHTEDFYFEKAQAFLAELESLLVTSQPHSERNEYFVQTSKVSILDIAIFPFVRQFAFVDKNKFDSIDLPKLKTWLAYFLESELFLSVMSKYPMWVEGGSEQLVFGQGVDQKQL